jgi:hypothetical protein
MLPVYRCHILWKFTFSIERTCSPPERQPKFQFSIMSMRFTTLVVQSIGILKNNRGKEEHLVATGICPSFRIDRLEACPTSQLYSPILSVMGARLLRTNLMGWKMVKPHGTNPFDSFTPERSCRNLPNRRNQPIGGLVSL